MCEYADARMKRIKIICISAHQKNHLHIRTFAYLHIQKSSVTKTSILCHKNNVHHNETILTL
jgi:hypothetical protein